MTTLLRASLTFREAAYRSGLAPCRPGVMLPGWKGGRTVDGNDNFQILNQGSDDQSI